MDAAPLALPAVIALSAGALGGGAYAAACHLTGENLAAAWVDECRLRRQAIRDLDRNCASNPRDSGIVVTLTSIPSRLPALAPTLKSLLRQTARPREIRVCLPSFSVREQRYYEPPGWLGELACIRVAECPDEGPATKFLSTLRSADRDQAVAIVDDDRIYHPRLLESFAAAAQAHPDEIIAGSGWRVPADLVDRPTTLAARLHRSPCVPLRANQVGAPRRVDIVQGVHGYVARPRFFDLEALGDFSAAPETVRFVDDVWISAHARVPCVVHPLRLAYTDYRPWEHRRHHAATSLGRMLNHSRPDRERGNSLALRYFSGRWPGRGASGNPST